MLRKRLLELAAEWKRFGSPRLYQITSGTMVCNMMCADAGEGIDTFMPKRKPEWKGR